MPIFFLNGSSYTVMYLLYIKLYVNFIPTGQYKYSSYSTLLGRNRIFLSKHSSSCRYIVQLSTENVLGTVWNLVLDFLTPEFLRFAFSAFRGSHFWFWNGCFLVVETLSSSGWKESLEASLPTLLENSLIAKFRS